MNLLWFEHSCFNSGGSDGSLDVSEQEVLLSPEGVSMTLLGLEPPVSVMTSAAVSVCDSSKLPVAGSSSVPAVPCVSVDVFFGIDCDQVIVGLIPMKGQVHCVQGHRACSNRQRVRQAGLMQARGRHAWICIGICCPGSFSATRTPPEVLGQSPVCLELFSTAAATWDKHGCRGMEMCLKKL